jgi:hypothetical protein
MRGATVLIFAARRHLLRSQIETKRLTYEHGGRKIYEWDQSLSDINVCVRARAPAHLTRLRGLLHISR